jgi:glycosyltransferase involved in cell wall biosynthesis
MRIAVCNAFGRIVGGVETYLDRVIPALRRAGHELAMLYEMDSPVDREPISSLDAPVWHISKSGFERAVQELRDWVPEVIYTNHANDGLERFILQIAPAVHYAHDYSATCISGSKAFSFPRLKACSQPFGAKCLMNYFPRRCGGLSALTMWRKYRFQSARLAILRNYQRILVASDAMRLEYLRNGFPSGQVEVVAYPVPGPIALVEGGHQSGSRRPPAMPPGEKIFGERSHETPADESAPDRPLRLLFAGRMVHLKGGELLLRALPHAAARLGRRLILFLAGDGSARTQWETQARILCAHYPAISVKFTGWLGAVELNQLIDRSDLLVVPSLWPEPFGLIGPEAGMRGLPAAAFATGGITQWLNNGVNGFVAPASPSTAAGLAEAIAKSLDDSAVYQRLRRGARSEAMKFSVATHVAKLEQIFAQVATRRPLHTQAVCSR